MNERNVTQLKDKFFTHHPISLIFLSYPSRRPGAHFSCRFPPLQLPLTHRLSCIFTPLSARSWFLSLPRSRRQPRFPPFWNAGTPPPTLTSFISSVMPRICSPSLPQ